MIGGGELGGKDEVEGEEGDGFKNSRVKDIGEISFVGGGVGGLVSVDMVDPSRGLEVVWSKDVAWPKGAVGRKFISGPMEIVCGLVLSKGNCIS